MNDDRALRVAAYAIQKGIRWMQCTSLGNTNPWADLDGNRPGALGQPYRPDRPDWLIDWPMKHPGNCFANKPFFDWLIKATFQLFDQGKYGAWSTDGNVFVVPGWYKTVEANGKENMV